MNIECKMCLLHNCSNHRFSDPSAFFPFLHSWSDKLLLVGPQKETKTELIALIKYYPNFEFFSILLSVTPAWMQPLLVFNSVMFYSYRSNRSTNTKADFVSENIDRWKQWYHCFFLPLEKLSGCVFLFLTLHVVKDILPSTKKF